MRKFLVCTDGSQYSRVCCEYAAWLATRFGAEIHVIYVTDLRRFEMPFITDLSGSLGIQPYQGMIGQLKEIEENKAEAIKIDTLKIFEKAAPDLKPVFHHRTGLLVDLLEEMEEGCDLVMLGKRGESAEAAVEHLGSTMERVVRASEKPCLVTSRSFREIRKLLLAFDGGKSCLKALKFLAATPAFHELELHVVVVAEDSGQEDDGLRQLREAEATLQEAGYKLNCQMLHGTPEDQIADYVGKQAVDLLVMGAYGHSRIRHLLIGSTTTEMIRRCRIPVLLFR